MQLPDEKVTLDLQLVLGTIYDEARYDLSIKYEHPLTPPLAEEGAQ